MKIFKNNKFILEGVRNKFDGLWDILFEPIATPLPTKTQQQLNIILPKNKSKYQLANVYHAALCSPTLTTLRQAINNNQLISWPAIQELNFNHSSIDTTATALGHLDQERKNLQSTRSRSSELTTKTHSLLNSIIPFTAKEMTNGDLMVAFPYPSSRGSKYLYLLYDYDSNAILVQPLKTRQAHEIKQAWETLTKRLTKHGHVRRHFVLDNECSQDLQQAIKKKQMDFQLVPPHVHRQ